MKRREFLQLAALGSAPAIVTGVGSASTRTDSLRVPSFDLDEATITDLQAAQQSGQRTAVSVTEAYLERIEQLNPALNAVIEVNPDAVAIARSLDEERQTQGPRGPLHGVPILIKDNIDTHDRMTTTAGSMALRDSIPHQDSFVAQKLRQAGAVILGKANLSEWANFRGAHSSSGWSARGGQTHNPYVLDRNPSGSSSGSAVAAAANLCSATVGTETDGSIISPSAVCGVVGIKPTVGLISRAGIIPISHTQDTAGPIARTVKDAAILLGALAGVDSRDPATQTRANGPYTDYTAFLDPNGLKGARLGVARRYFGNARLSSSVLEAALEAMEHLGAILIDLPDDPPLGRFGDAESTVLHYEFKADLNAYLASLGPDAPIHNLEELIAFNEAHRDTELRFFGQEAFLRAQEKGPLTDQAYLDAVTQCRRIGRTEGIDAIMDKHQLDAIVAPSGGPAGVTDLVYGDRNIGGSSSPAAVAGYPNITAPAGYFAGLPIGISFFGRAYTEPVLLRIAFAFEQATQHRKPPTFLKTIG